ISFPKDRLSAILKNMNTDCLLLINKNLSHLYAANVNKVHIEDALEVLDQMEGTTPSITPTTNSVVYILHTSGSTGQPKGVYLGQEALVNLLLWQKENS